MDRRMILWTLVVFFGSGLVFKAINDATEQSSAGVTLGLQAVALVAMVAGLVLITRRRG